MVASSRYLNAPNQGARLWRLGPAGIDELIAQVLATSNSPGELNSRAGTVPTLPNVLASDDDDYRVCDVCPSTLRCSPPQPPARPSDMWSGPSAAAKPVTSAGENMSSSVKEVRWAGAKVSYLLVNAQSLVKSPGGVKMVDFELLLEKYHWPSLVCVTEVDGAAGKLDLEDRLRDQIMRRYDVRYSMRSVSKTGGPVTNRGKVGGGIALLVHRRLCVTIRDMSLPIDKDAAHWMDGHVRWYKLVPKVVDRKRRPASTGGSYALHRPLAITCAYVPPIGEWGHRVRELAFSTMAAIDELIRDLRRHEDVFAITLEHSNHPDGGVDLPLEFSDLCQPAEMQMLLDHAAANSRVLHRSRGRGALSLQPDGTLMLRRKKSLNSPPTWTGAAYSVEAALLGKVSVSGVLGARHSDSWTQCKFCKRGIRDPRCQQQNCGRMFAVHDQVRVPVETVLMALLCPLGGSEYLSCKTRRVWWSDNIDHAITWGSFLVAPLRSVESAAIEEPQLVKNGCRAHPQKRRQLPTNLLARWQELQRIAQTSETLVDQLPSTGVNLDKDAEAFTTALLSAQGESSIDCHAEPNAVANAARARDKAWSELKCMRRRWRDHCEDPAHISWSDRDQHEHNRARRTHKALQVKLEKCRAMVLSSASRRAKRNAPLEYWRILADCARDPGAEKTVTLGLLDAQTDKHGRLISSNRQHNWTRAVRNRQSTHSIRSDLGAAQLELDESMVLVSEVCRAIVHSPGGQSLSPLSYANLCANDAAYSMRSVDTRRGRPGIDSLEARIVSAKARLAARAGVELLGARVRTQHHDLVLELSRDIEVVEVAHIFGILGDVGPGTDGLSPIMLRFQREGIVPARATELINVVWRTGVLPEQWQDHRCLLHYKGKCSDPCCLDNYRGLGIDQALLKVLSLVMLDRLDFFLKATRALSPAQGGFQRQRGTPEQIFTLSETVRAAILRADVHLVFIDIAGAYDSVLHPILWRKCIERGLFGRFLTTLMAIYHNASIVLELGQERSAPIPIECGVLQGNPLSPALFNIYIDDVLRSCQNKGAADSDHPWGLPLPRVKGRDDGRVLTDAPTQDDFLTCLYFADDGVLMDFDQARLQTLIDLTQTELARIGLLLNIPKTKWLLVARASLGGSDGDAKAALQNVSYQSLRTKALATPLHVCQKPISLVTNFDYLGAKVSWRWNWQSAWREAVRRARFELHALLRGGLHSCGVTMDAVCEYIRGKVSCHFNYIAAVSGAGGCRTTAPWLAAEDVLTQSLRAVSGYSFADGATLKLESGTWDQRTRIDMLQLRFFAKLSTADHESPMYRAMCLSVRSLSPAQCASPATANATLDQLHRQPWAQSLSAALSRFGMQPIDATSLWRPMSELVQLEYGTGPGDRFAMIHPASVPLQENITLASALRLALKDRPSSRLWLSTVGVSREHQVEGKSYWPLPTSALYETVFGTWTDTLRDACYAALKRLGNRVRQTIVAEYLTDVSMDPSSSARRYAAIKRASYQEAYWHLPDLASARRLLRIRLDNASVRDVVLRSGRGGQGGCRQDDRLLRPCYCCGAIGGHTGIYSAETVDHTLLWCPAYDALRRQFMQEVITLSAEPSTVALCAAANVPVPLLQPLSYDGRLSASSWLMVMKLCTGVSGFHRAAYPPVQPAQTVPPAAGSTEEARVIRAQPDLIWDHGAADSVARWVACLMRDWTGSLRPVWLDTALHQGQAPGPGPVLPPAGHPGQRLATVVARFSLNVFSHRRRLMGAVGGDFAGRTRDVVTARPTRDACMALDPVVAPAATPSVHDASLPPGILSHSPSASVSVVSFHSASYFVQGAGPLPAPVVFSISLSPVVGSRLPGSSVASSTRPACVEAPGPAKALPPGRCGVVDVCA